MLQKRLNCNPDCPLQTPNRASGPKWEKNGRKMDLAPPETKGKKWLKNGKVAIVDQFLRQLFPFFGRFFPFFPGGAEIHVSAIFPPFRAGGPIWGLYRAIGTAKHELENVSWYVLISRHNLMVKDACLQRLFSPARVHNQLERKDGVTRFASSSFLNSWQAKKKEGDSTQKARFFSRQNP